MGWSKWFVVAGLVLLAVVWGRGRNTDGRYVVPPVSQLVTAEGKAVEAREVQRKNKKGRLLGVWLELDVLTPQGVVTVAVDKQLAGSAFDGLKDTAVTARYNPADQNALYVLAADGRERLSYDKVAAAKRDRADGESEDRSLLKWLASGLIVLGALGWFVGRKR